MKKIYYLLFLVIGIIACSKDSLTTDAAQSLKVADAKTHVNVVSSSVTDPEQVCAGVEAEYCVNIPQAYKGNGDSKTSEVQVQLYDETSAEYIQIAHGSVDTQFCFSYTFDLAGTYNLRYQYAGGQGQNNFTVIVDNCDGVCTHGLGWWKNHSNDNPGNQENLWPVSSLDLGSVNYTQNQLNEIFDQSVQGNGLVSLAHHLAAAKLNIANGVDGSSISSVITDADALIGSLVVPPVGGGELTTSEVGTLKDALEAFNNSNPCEEELD